MIENYLSLPAQAQNPTDLTSPTKILGNYSKWAPLLLKTNEQQRYRPPHFPETAPS